MSNAKLLLALALVSTAAACGDSGSTPSTHDGGASDGAAAGDSAASADAHGASDAPNMLDTSPHDSKAPPADGPTIPTDGPAMDDSATDGPSGDDASTDGPATGDGAMCAAPGSACMQGSDCCSNSCNGGGHCK